MSYAAARLLGLIVLSAMAHHFNEHTVDLLGKYDGAWFLGIVHHGYDTTLAHRPDGSLINTNIVFFPAYPYLIWIIASATGLSALHAGLLASFLAGLAGAWGIFAVANHLYGRKVGTLLALLWAIQTHAVVESMVYSEGLFTALAAWCLYALLRRRWLDAGLLCAFAGLTRGVAVVLVAIVLVSAVVAVSRREDGWQPWLAALVAPIGLVGFYVWVARALGRADGWFYMQDKGWLFRFDGGRDTVRTLIHRVLLTQSTWLEFYEVAAVIVGSIVLFAVLALLRPPWPLLAYAGGLLVLTVGTANYYHSLARFLLPAFPLLLPLALALARVRRSVLALIVVPIALVSAWYGGYLLLEWPISF